MEMINLDYDYVVSESIDGIEVYDQNEKYLTTLQGERLSNYFKEDDPTDFEKNLLVHHIDDMICDTY